MNVRMSVLPLLATSSLFTAGCAHEAAAPPIQAPAAPITAEIRAPITPVKANGNIYLSDDITRACKIAFDDVAKAPKFEFDESAILPQDRGVLAQVAACVMTGPLKGRALKLVGRADPRGEAGYNMALGERRSASAGNYLANLGVNKSQIAETSRGELGSTGTDAAGWERDRRVDILLQ